MTMTKLTYSQLWRHDFIRYFDCLFRQFFQAFIAIENAMIPQRNFNNGEGEFRSELTYSQLWRHDFIRYFDCLFRQFFQAFIAIENAMIPQRNFNNGEGEF